MTLRLIRSKLPKKCGWRGCKKRPIFPWSICSVGEPFDLCAEHDLALNRVLLAAIGRRPVAKILERYRTSKTRVRYLKLPKAKQDERRVLV